MTMKRVLVILLFLAAAIASAIDPSGPTSARVLWDPSSSPGITNYTVYWGAASQVYTNRIDAGTNLSVVVTGLLRGVTYYFAATATDTKGRASGFSNEPTWLGPAAQPAGSRIAGQARVSGNVNIR